MFIPTDKKDTKTEKGTARISRSIIPAASRIQNPAGRGASPSEEGVRIVRSVPRTRSHSKSSDRHSAMPQPSLLLARCCELLKFRIILQDFQVGILLAPVNVGIAGLYRSPEHFHGITLHPQHPVRTSRVIQNICIGGTHGH